MQNIRVTRANRRTRGVTLVESLCVLSIVAASVGFAMPSLKNWHERQALLSAAAELETDIQFARAQAVASSASIHMTIKAEQEGACYVMHSGTAEDCSCSTASGATCNGHAQVIRYVTYPPAGAVKLLNRDTTLTFDPRLGTVTPAATFKLQTPSATVHQIVSIMGRTRSCSPGKLAGFKAC